MFKNIFFSIFCIVALNQFSLAQTDNVISLKSATNSQWVGNGQTGWYQGYEVRVKNIGPIKKVFIHYKDTDGRWKDLPLTFKQNYKNYDVFGSSANGSVNGGVEFAIRYEVNGKVYWNNNEGRNYILPTGYYIMGGNVTMQNLTLIRYGCPGWMGPCFQAHIGGSLHVKNLAPTKRVGVRCSYDNGSNWFNVAASYAYRHTYYDDIEVWTIDDNSRIVSNDYRDTPVQCTAFYDNNWDNNFNQNYLLKANSSGEDEIK